MILTEDTQGWWRDIPHFIHAPFYTDAYAFGHLPVLFRYKKYRQEGAAFVPMYLSRLSVGGSKSPNRLLKEKRTLDIADRDFRREELGILEEMVSEAEAIERTLS